MSVGKFFWTYKFHVLFFLFSFLILTHVYLDPDLGWHIASGQQFLQTGRIVLGDQFSWTMHGYVWGSYFFLFDALTAFLVGTFGYLTACVLFGFVDSVAVLFLLPKKLSFGAFGASLVGIYVLTFSLGVRPSAMSLPFFVVVLIFCRRRLYSNLKNVFWWFLLFSLWANFHQGFLVGILVLVGFMGVDYLKGLRQNMRIWALTLGAVLVGTLATPYNFGLWTGIVNDMIATSTWHNVAEYLPVIVFFPANLIWGLSGVIFIYLLVKNFKRADPSLFMLGSFFFAISFIANNNLLFWGSVYIYIVSRMTFPRVPFDKYSKALLTLVFAAVVLALSLNFLLALSVTSNLDQRLTLDKYPTRAAAYMEKEGLVVNVLNDYGWGGYLIWQHPKIPVFIDGRMTGWRMNGQSFLSLYNNSLNTGKCDLRANYDIRVLLLKTGAALGCFSDFRIVYRDDVAQVLVLKN